MIAVLCTIHCSVIILIGIEEFDGANVFSPRRCRVLNVSCGKDVYFMTWKVSVGMPGKNFSDRGAIRKKLYISGDTRCSYREMGKEYDCWKCVGMGESRYSWSSGLISPLFIFTGIVIFVFCGTLLTIYIRRRKNLEIDVPPVTSDHISDKLIELTPLSTPSSTQV